MKRRDLYFMLFVILSFGLFWTPLSTLVSQALQYDHYSHILVVPVISTCFIYWISGFCWKRVNKIDLFQEK